MGLLVEDFLASRRGIKTYLLTSTIDNCYKKECCKYMENLKRKETLFIR